VLAHELNRISGRATAHAVSRWLPTAAARVRSRVCSSGICGGQSGAGAGFLRALKFPLPVFIPTILHHHNHLGQATIGQSVAAVPSGPSSTPPPTKRIKKNRISVLDFDLRGPAAIYQLIC
jgi:hypothetical protein